MKYLTVLVMSLLLLCSCDGDKMEPSTEKTLRIEQSYQPCTSEFNIHDTEWVEKIKGWSDKKFIVNDLSELPNDPLGFSDLYTGIDFSKYTLLLTYDIHNWNIDVYRNRYYYDTIRETYNWTIFTGTYTNPDENSEIWYFTRYAILVDKLPADTGVRMKLVLSAINREKK